MRSLIPILSVILALVASGAIAKIAWDLTAEKPPKKPDQEPGAAPDDEATRED